MKEVGSKPSDLSKFSKQRQLAKGVLERKVEHTKINKRLAAAKKKKSKTIRQTFDKNLWGQDGKIFFYNCLVW